MLYCIVLYDTMERCTLCTKQISVANAEKYGLDSHAKHQCRQNELPKQVTVHASLCVVDGQ